MKFILLMFLIIVLISSCKDNTSDATAKYAVDKELNITCVFQETSSDGLYFTGLSCINGSYSYDFKEVEFKQYLKKEIDTKNRLACYSGIRTNFTNISCLRY